MLTKIFKYANFEWDKGNIDKNQKKHNVSSSECEETFFHQPLIVIEDETHSKSENRFHALGKTAKNRLLFISFTIRNRNVRIISARNMSKKEKQFYEKS